MIRYATRPTSLGRIFLAARDAGVVGLYFIDDDLIPAFTRLEHDFPGVPKVEDPSSLAGWLDKIEQAIEHGPDAESIPIDLHGTEFQLRVWRALREIRRGETLTYGQLSQRLGLPVGAARAVGTACGANPVSYLVPCHRVIPAGGGLGGYRWGLERKRCLLERERGNGSPAQSLLAFAER